MLLGIKYAGIIILGLFAQGIGYFLGLGILYLIWLGLCNGYEITNEYANEYLIKFELWRKKL